MLVQFTPPIEDYFQIPLLILVWTILWGLFYLRSKPNINENVMQNHREIMRMNIQVLVAWLVPIGMLALGINFIIFRTLNPLNAWILIQLVLIVIDMIRLNQRRRKNTI